MPRCPPREVSTFSAILTNLISDRAAASDALGPRGNRRVIKAGSCDQADQAFMKQYMRGDIDEIVDLDALDTFEALQLET